MYGNAPKTAANKEWDWDSDAIKCMLCTVTYVPNQDTHIYKSSVTNEISGTGYTATGATLTSTTSTYTGATNTLALDAADTVWSTATFTARIAVVYSSTPGSDATRPLICWVDFGSDQSVSAGNFTITWAAAGIVTFVVS
jgi:hypothetical protein